MKKISILCAALLAAVSLAACASGPSAAEKVIGTEKTVAMDDLKASSASDKEKEYIARGGNVLVREQDGREAPYASVGRDSYALMLRQLFTKDAGIDT